MSVNNPIKYAEMTDEQITAIKRRIETFTKSNEYFDKFVNHVKVERGAKTMKSRRVVKPFVRPEDVKPSAEDVAPRPGKIAVQTFEHSVEIYRDKIGYTKEDVLYGYDDIVQIAGDTLSEIGVQKLDIIKGTPFINSACTATAESTLLGTLSKVAIILQKNEAKAWSNGRYLAHVSPEALEAIRVELEAKGTSISEATKEDIDKGIIGHYGRWDFAVCPSQLLIKNPTKQWMVCMGRRPNGQSPIDASTMEGVEVINNPLGSGVLLDEDGNYTSDDNKQRGSVAMNINGIGAYVNDDLCVIDVEISVNEVGASNLNQAELTGFVSQSPDSTLVLNAVGADGKAVSGAKLTLKEKSSSGTAVTVDENNKATVIPGNTYYYSVAATGYATFTGTFKANAGDCHLIVPMVKTA
jgi:hypothetical protein